MAHPTLQDTLSKEQIVEIVALSKTKSVPEIANIYEKHRRTIYYHLRKNGIITWKPRNNSFDIKEYNFKNKEKIKEYQKNYRQGKIIIKRKQKRKQGRGLIPGKSYKELLAIENEKRKKAGLYEFKKPSPWISMKGL